MKELSFERMEEVNGGKLGLWEAAGVTCAAAFGGIAFGGFGFFVTAAMFGPSCVGLVLGASLEKWLKLLKTNCYEWIKCWTNGTPKWR